jgi:hypothetical protein
MGMPAVPGTRLKRDIVNWAIEDRIGDQQVKPSGSLEIVARYDVSSRKQIAFLLR